MHGSDALTAIAEISLGLAGFTGIVMALYSRSDSWSEFDAVRSLYLLLIGFGTLILSLLPFALHFFGLPESIIWRSCSGTMLAYLSVFFLMRRVDDQLEWTQIPHNDRMRWFASIGLVLNGFLQLANLWYAQLSLFFLGLLWYLTLGCVQFAVILYLRPRS